MIERRGTTARASQIVKHNGVAYLSSQVAEGDSIQDQTRYCLAKVHDLLIEAVISREQMLGATIWLSYMSHFVGLNEIWNDWVPAGCAPARACGEAKMARTELLVEIIIDAAYS
jgi:enamine deaminase RidA (YjgF/YER057c/UK114 family)